ncbi:MAG: inositol monophosphatase [Ignavibacterium sp.]|nr:inositol monophosphatase [Ignavibacterium sp.]
MIDDLIYISKSAGEIIRNYFGKNISVEFKSDVKNLVTLADKESEKTIIDFIKKKYPSHGILAEESGQQGNDSDYLWVIDPLDGTSNFAHGLPIFSVSIGLQYKNEIVAGVVYDIMRDKIYYAEKGSGAYKEDVRISVSKKSKIEESFLVTGFPYNINENPENAFEKFIAMTKASRAVRRLGSAAIDFCYVAEGVFDGFWEVHLNPWDICAGKILVEEAGGKVTDFFGNKIDIFNKTILASNGIIHQKMISILINN